MYTYMKAMKAMKAKRRGPGRPRLGRTVPVKVTLRPVEAVAALRKAAAAGLRLPNYIRTLLGFDK